jgi:hypothetical protein
LAEMDKRVPTRHVVRDPDQTERVKLKDTIRMSDARRKELLAEMGESSTSTFGDDSDVEIVVVAD